MTDTSNTLKARSNIEFPFLIHRFIFDEKFTIGRLFSLHNFFCYTLEPPFNSNTCCHEGGGAISPGDYFLKKTFSRKFCDELPLVCGVQCRSDILIHCGNFPQDTEGCILLGVSYSPSGKLFSSDEAMKKFKFLFDLFLTNSETVPIRIFQSSD